MKELFSIITMKRKQILFFILIAIAVVTIKPRVGGWNDASRMATIQSLVENQSLIIDQSVFVNTGDKVFINGHFYSDKPALPSILGAIVYLPLFHLGLKLGYRLNLAYYLITLFTVKIFWIFGVIAFYFALGFCDIEEKKRLWLTLAMGIGSLYFSWSSTFNNHSLAASQLIIGLYFLLRAQKSDSVRRNLFFSGFFFSLAGTGDIPTSVFFIGFSIFIFMNSNLRKSIIYYFLPLLITAVPALFVNYYICGSMIPVQLHHQYFEYPGSVWIGNGELSGIGANSGLVTLRYSFFSLFGPRGFLFYNPLLFIAIPYLLKEIMNRRAFRKEAIVIGIATLIIMLYYFVFTSNYGGGSYSIRWFVPLLPLLFFFIYPFFNRYSLSRHRIFMTLLFVSMTISSIGLINPWSKTALSPIPLMSNIKEIIFFILK